jgi:hypothetical protein
MYSEVLFSYCSISNLIFTKLQQMSVSYSRINFNGLCKFEQANVIPECKSAVVRMHNDLLHWDKLLTPIISIVIYTVFSSNHNDVASILVRAAVSSCDDVVLESSVITSLAIL